MLRGPRDRRLEPWLAALCVAAVLVFLAALTQYHHKNTGLTELIYFGDWFEDQRLPAVLDVPHYLHRNSPGYDGQWYAQLAVEPLLRNPDLATALDTAPYRARRILFSWTAYLAGLGRPAWILKAYAVQNVVAWLLLAWLLLRWLPPTDGRACAAWFGCLFGVGLIGSVRFALLEGPSLVLLGLAIRAVEARRHWAAAALMGAGGLGRETSLGSLPVVIDGLPRTVREAGRLAGRVALAVLPYVIWVLYVRSVFPDFQLSNPDSFAQPFSGVFGKWVRAVGGVLRDGVWTPAHWELELLAVVALTAQAGYLLVRHDRTSAWWRAGAPYLVLLPFLSPLVWAGVPGAVTRVALPMTFAFNVLLVRERPRWFWPVWALGNVSIVHSAFMLLR